MANSDSVVGKVDSETDSTVLKVASALFKKNWPFYDWAKQDDKTKFRFIDEAGQLIATLAAANLVISEAKSETPGR